MAIIKNTYDTVKQAFQDLIAPQLAELRGEMNAIHADIRRIDSRMDTTDKRTDDRLGAIEKRLDDKLDALTKRLDDNFTALRTELSLTRQHVDDKMTMLSRRLDDALEVRERLAALEAKLAAH